MPEPFYPRARQSPRARQRWSNWSGTASAEVLVAETASVAEVRQVIVAAHERGLRVKPVGAGHSFTSIALTDGVQLRLERLSGVIRADRETGLVTVAAGTRLAELSDVLWRLGLSLQNLGDIDVQSVAGALATGTHGTGARLGGLATQVVALQLALADGSLLECSADDHPDVFAAARVGLGALGVLTAVTLACVPAFALAAAEAPASLDETLAELDTEIVGNDHFEFSWFPHTRRVLSKRNNRVLPGTPLQPLGRVRYLIEDQLLSNGLLEVINRATTWRPGLIRPTNAISARALAARAYVDRSYRVFASPQRVRLREMEYAVPRAAVPELLARIEDHLARSGELVAFPVRVRFAAGDDIWLSTAYGRDTGYVAVRQYHRRDHEPYFHAVEDLAVALGGRPHWGKIHYRDADGLRGSYPRFEEFRAARDRLDPDRLFGNDYLSRVLGE